MIKNPTAVIYGTGKRFNNNYFLQFLLPEITKIYNVQGISDKKKPDFLGKINLKFIERSSKLKRYDYIIITSDIYYEEIRNELIVEFEIDEKTIIPLNAIEERIKFHPELFVNLKGIEIGGPSDIFKTIYSVCKNCDGVNYNENTVWWEDSGRGYNYKEKLLGDVIIADAVDLSLIKDDVYDFCLSSNNLEHIANPLKALFEFRRIVKSNGYILIVVPRKEKCFDHRRNVTTIEHLVEDYKNNVDEEDLTHLDEIINFHDIEMDPGVASLEEFIERSQKNFKNRCLHHHIFDEQLLQKIFKFIEVNILDSGEILGNYYIIGKV